MAQVTTGQWGKLLDPIVDEVFYENLEKQPAMYQEVFNVSPMDKASEKHVTGVGVEDWRVSGEAQAANFTKNLQGFTKNYVPRVWKTGFQITREMVDDDLYDVARRGAAQLAQTAIRTIDKEAAKVFQNATNTNFASGADGVALVSSSHTREDGGTNLDNNDTNGVLNETNLETALVNIGEELDGRGELIEISPDTLLVPRALEKEAKILMQSTGRVATANNDINVYNGMLSVMVWDRISNQAGGSDTHWFVLDRTMARDGSGLNVKMRVNPEVGRETVDEETHVHKWVGYMRFDIDFTDWRHTWGSTGTA